MVVSPYFLWLISVSGWGAVYVAQVGLAQTKAMAQAAGMTGSEEREAVQCLEKKT
jgi:hypothetical protein